MALYRILRQTTDSLQPGSGCTFWRTEVLYCGYDRAEAIRIYHESSPTDFGGCYGVRSQRTRKQSKEILVTA